MGMQVIRHSERPELWTDTAAITREVWPEYNLHSEDPNGYWGRLFDEFAEFQFVLYDDDEQEVIAEGHTCRANGTAARKASGTASTRPLRRRSRHARRVGNLRRCARLPRRSGRASKVAVSPTGCLT